MTKEQFKQKLREHNFNSYMDFLNFVEEEQKMSYADKYSLTKEEYDAEHNKPIEGQKLYPENPNLTTLQYKVVRTYDEGSDTTHSLKESFNDGWQFLRASEYVPLTTISKNSGVPHGYIEYILYREELEI